MDTNNHPSLEDRVPQVARVSQEDKEIRPQWARITHSPNLLVRETCRALWLDTQFSTTIRGLGDYMRSHLTNLLFVIGTSCHCQLHVITHQIKWFEGTRTSQVCLSYSEVWLCNMPIYHGGWSEVHGIKVRVEVGLREVRGLGTRLGMDG
jgi:hypothetical protein